MQVIILSAIALYIAIYCANYAKMIFKEKNKLGGVAVACLVPLSLASPFAFFLIR